MNPDPDVDWQTLWPKECVAYIRELKVELARLRAIEAAARTFYHRFRAEADQRFEGQGLGPVEYALRTALEGSE